MASGYLLMKPDGDVFQIDDWQPGIGLVDFSNPDACDWYASKLKALLDIGDFVQTDFAERIPVDVKYHNGGDPERMHNYYTYLPITKPYSTCSKRKKAKARPFSSHARQPAAIKNIHSIGEAMTPVIIRWPNSSRRFITGFQRVLVFGASNRISRFYRHSNTRFI